MKTKIDYQLPQVVLVDNLCQLRPFNSSFQWECIINISILDYATYQFITLVHCVSQSEKSEVVPHVLEWCKKEFGEHIFNPQLIVLDGDLATFDSVHTQYSKFVHLYVPFFGYTY